MKEVWEVSYNPKADDISAGMIHDFKYREGKFIPGFLNPQRTQLDDYLDDFYFTQGYDEVMGASRNDAKAAVSGQVVNLDARKKIADLELPGMPHLGSGISWTVAGQDRDGDAQPQRRADQHHRHDRPGRRSSRSRPAAPASSCAATKTAATRGPIR